MAQPPVGSGSSVSSGKSGSGGLLSGRRLLALIGLLVVIGVLVIQRLPELPFGRPDEKPLFPDLAAIELASINLYNPINGAVMTITRGSDGIWIREETGEIIDPNEADLLAQTIVMLSYREVVPMSAESPLAPEGFDPTTRMFIEFLEVDGTHHRIAIGNVLVNRTEGFYAAVDQQALLYVVPRGAVDYLINTLREATEILN